MIVQLHYSSWSIVLQPLHWVLCMHTMTSYISSLCRFNLSFSIFSVGNHHSTNFQYKYLLGHSYISTNYNPLTCSNSDFPTCFRDRPSILDPCCPEFMLGQWQSQFRAQVLLWPPCGYWEAISASDTATVSSRSHCSQRDPLIIIWQHDKVILTTLYTLCWGL